MQTPQLPLDPISDGHIHINRDAWISETDGLQVVLVRGVPFWHYSHQDRQAESLAIASLSRAGLAKATELALALGKSRNTVAAYKRHLEHGGVAELLHLRRGPKGAHKVKPSVERAILKLKSQGLANAQIAVRLRVSDMSVGRLLRRKGWSKANARPRPLPGIQPAIAASTEPKLEDSSSELPRAVREATERRTMERALAAVGLIQQAETKLVSGRSLCCLGALVAIPPLIGRRTPLAQ